MTITDLIRWCFNNNIELKIEPDRDRLSVKATIKTFTNGRTFGESIDILYEGLLQSKVEDTGSLMIEQMIGRLVANLNDSLIKYGPR